MLGICVSAQAADKAATANARAQRDAAKKVYEIFADDWTTQGPPLEKLYIWSRGWMKCEQRLAGSKTECVAAAEAHLSRMKRWEEWAKNAHSRQ